GLRPVRWSPLAGCQDDAVVKLRVDALVDAADQGGDQVDAEHWREGGKQILRAYFYAAAHHPDRPGDLSVVRRWLASNEAPIPSRDRLVEPQEILDQLGTPAARLWAEELRGVGQTPPREQGSFFSRARKALAATSDPAVMES